MAHLPHVIHEHCSGHRTDAARNRRDVRCDFFHPLKVHISMEFAIGAAGDANVDDHCTGLHHLRNDQSRLTNGGYQNISLMSNPSEVFRVRMTDCHGSVSMLKHKGHGDSDNIGATDNHSPLALKITTVFM